ncbi:MAG: hypothetical protein F4Y98_00895 [Chloroflexi bacterium]|nr:hypothetical protein [Chloroflexota bacterium]
MAVDPNVIRELVEALGDRGRALPASAFRTDLPEASQCGIYAWWADEPARQLIAETLDTDVAPLIYVGKAGDGESSQTLGTRVFCGHLNGRTTNSTLRRSLTGILKEVDWFASAHTKTSLIRRSPVLSAWMREHLEVAIIPVERSELRKAERDALTCYDPPLNLVNVPDPTRDPVRSSRNCGVRCR